MNKTTFIYGLKEKDGEVRYVGKSDNPKKRFLTHMGNYKRDNTHKTCWIKHCLKNNIEIEIIILEEIDYSLWQEREIFWISQFKDLTNHTEGGEGVTLNRPLFSYEEAAEWVKNSKLSIKSCQQWMKLYKNKKITNSIPGDPRVAYSGKGWKSWSEFLGTDYVCNILKHENYISFEEAVIFARPLKIKSSRDWIVWHRKNKPVNIPRYPCTTYKEWTGWTYFLGTNFKRNTEFIPFDDAKKYIKKFNLKTRQQFRKWTKENHSFEVEIPRSPSTVYKNEGWHGWKDFLGQ